MSLGARIREVRIQNGWTLEQFGVAIGELTTSKPPIKGNITNWEHDKSQPSPERLKAIASLGNIPVMDLLAEVKDSSNSTDARLTRMEDKLDLILKNQEKEKK